MPSVIGFDYGESRIGIAVGQLEFAKANPVATLQNPASGLPWEQINKIIEQWQPSTLIVGCVEHDTQNDNRLKKNIHNFCKKLKARYHLPVEIVDEFYTSATAYDMLKDMRKEGRKKITKEDIDKVSAALILDHWLSNANTTTSSTL